MFEAVIDSDTMLGEVSQSAQWAPFDPYYQVSRPLPVHFHLRAS